MDTKQLAKLVEDYGASRTSRLALDKQAKKAKEEENRLESAIVEEMLKSGLHSSGGDTIRVTLQTKQKPIVKDWQSLYDYIRDNDAFDLLHRRLTDTAVLERTEQGENIPGLGTFPVNKLTVSKI